MERYRSDSSEMISGFKNKFLLLNIVKRHGTQVARS